MEELAEAQRVRTNDSPHVAFPVVGTHGVLAMKQDITCNEYPNENDGEDDGASSSQFLHYHFPHPAQEKEENSHEYIIETEP